MLLLSFLLVPLQVDINSASLLLLDLQHLLLLPSRSPLYSLSQTNSSGVLLASRGQTEEILCPLLLITHTVVSHHPYAQQRQTSQLLALAFSLIFFSLSLPTINTHAWLIPLLSNTSVMCNCVSRMVCRYQFNIFTKDKESTSISTK